MAADLKECAKCKRVYASKFAKCPHCSSSAGGAAVGLGCVGLIVVIIIIALFGSGGGQSGRSSSATSTEQAPPSSDQTTTATTDMGWKYMKRDDIGCTDRDVFEKIVSLAVSGDKEAYSTYTAAQTLTGICQMLNGGTP